VLGAIPGILPLPLRLLLLMAVQDAALLAIFISRISMM
jgi:hypothetical protein